MHGRRLRGAGGTAPINLRWGTAHASVPPIFEPYTVIGCEAKYELTKKGVKEEVDVLK